MSFPGILPQKEDSHSHIMLSRSYPTNISLFKVNNKNTIKRCEICSKSIIKTPKRRP